jgi:VanZ family protein
VSNRFACNTFWLLLCVALTVLILWLALMPGGSAPRGLGWDKLNHAAAIGVVTCLAFFARHPASQAGMEAFLYGVSLGALIEILQGTFTTTRSAEWGDLLADVIGSGCVWGITTILSRNRKQTCKK